MRLTHRQQDGSSSSDISCLANVPSFPAWAPFAHQNATLPNPYPLPNNSTQLVIPNCTNTDCSGISNCSATPSKKKRTTQLFSRQTDEQGTSQQHAAQQGTSQQGAAGPPGQVQGRPITDPLQLWRCIGPGFQDISKSLISNTCSTCGDSLTHMPTGLLSQYAQAAHTWFVRLSITDRNDRPAVITISTPPGSIPTLQANRINRVTVNDRTGSQVRAYPPDFTIEYNLSPSVLRQFAENIACEQGMLPRNSKTRAAAADLARAMTSMDVSR